MAPKTARKVAPNPMADRKNKSAKDKYHLFESTPKDFRPGTGVIQPKRDLYRFVKWPKYIRIQRKKQVLLKRSKIPPALNQFNHPYDPHGSRELFKFLGKYKPMSKSEATSVARDTAKKIESDKKVSLKKEHVLHCGMSHVTSLIESKKAKLVLIAHDVDPIDLVVWMPALCRKKDVPYAIVKSKSSLGKLVNFKKATCVALCGVKKEDQSLLDSISKTCRSLFNDNVDIRRQHGGQIQSTKHYHAKAKREKALAEEQSKKLGY